jgi:YidC/Oxa1 family membrane protein insertase
MIGHLFTILIAQPVFNLLVLIYALLPGHNLGVAIILFTAIVRLALWPLVKKQLHQTKLMRKLQPELKRIKKEAKGDRQKESLMTMELYKERGVNPFGSLGIVLVQLPILIALYSGLNKVIHHPHDMISFAYPALQQLTWMKELAANINLFDGTLLHVVDLTRAALGNGGVYWPAMVLVLGSAITQYYQTKQLLPSDKDGRSLRTILREAGTGKQADQSEVNAAVGRSTKYFLPIMIVLFTVSLPSALSLYWFVGGLIAFWQQSIVLKEDEEELEELADAPAGTAKKTATTKSSSSSTTTKITRVTAGSEKDLDNIPEATIVAESQATPKKTAKKSPSKKHKTSKKRRKK